MSNENNIEKLKDLLDACTATPIEKLISNPDWGKITFEQIRPVLERTFRLTYELKTLPVELLPNEVQANIVNSLNQLKDSLKRISSFSIEGSNPSAARDEIANQFSHLADAFFNASHTYVPYLAYQNGDVQRNIKALTTSIERAEELIRNAKEEIALKSIEIDSILSAARDASASVGVAHFSADFETEAKNLDVKARHWLITTIVMAGFTATASILMMFLTVPAEATTGQIVQLFTSKIVLLGLLFSTTVWCAKMYKATKHQVRTNQHRSNSLRTFQAFIKAASDDSSRSAVLLETTKSIFAITPSGYLDNEAPSESGTKIVEIVKNTAQAASSLK